MAQQQQQQQLMRTDRQQPYERRIKTYDCVEVTDNSLLRNCMILIKVLFRFYYNKLLTISSSA
jgi:hypothetical protein